MIRVERWQAGLVAVALVGAAGTAASMTASCHSSSAGKADAAASAHPMIVRPRAPVTPGELALDLKRSKLSLTTIKDRVSPVTATLTFQDGAVSLDGPTPSARLSVDLDTFDSSIAIRNERVRNLFFETSALGWETAELVFAPLPRDVLDQLGKERRVSHVSLDADLKVHGHASKLAVVVDAGYGEAGVLWVKSAEPVVVKISDLALSDNLRRLNAICMHDSVDDAVTVDVALEFAPSH